MGLPVIVSDVNGADEVVISGYNGIIIPRKNTDALYSAMAEMVSKPDLRHTMSSNSRNGYHRKRYNIQIYFRGKY